MNAGHRLTFTIYFIAFTLDQALDSLAILLLSQLHKRLRNRLTILIMEAQHPLIRDLTHQRESLYLLNRLARLGGRRCFI